MGWLGREPEIVKDLRVGPVFFKLKKHAFKAKEQATKYGISTRLTRTSFHGYRYKLSKA